VLAAIARAVNDGTGEAGRARLAALVPAMIGTGGSGPWLLASCARLVLCCAGAALDHTGADEPEMSWARETALAVLDPVTSADVAAAQAGQPGRG
jgi:hypothetical protein